MVGPPALPKAAEELEHTTEMQKVYRHMVSWRRIIFAGLVSLVMRFLNEVQRLLREQKILQQKALRKRLAFWDFGGSWMLLRRDKLVSTSQCYNSVLSCTTRLSMKWVWFKEDLRPFIH